MEKIRSQRLGKRERDWERTKLGAKEIGRAIERHTGKERVCETNYERKMGRRD